MKRATSMLGALALMAAGFLFAAPAAHAAITCTKPSATPNTWPYDQSTGTNGLAPVKYCDNDNGVTKQVSAQQGLSIASPLNDLTARGPDLYSKFSGDYNSYKRIQFYLFYDLDEYNTYFGSSLTNYGAVGFTRYDAFGNPLYSALFTHVKNASGTWIAVPGQDLQDALMHEAGHWADSFYFSEVGGELFVSDSSVWSTLLNYDWSHSGGPISYPIGVNQHHNCTATPVGMFRGYKDYAGAYVCTGATGTGGSLSASYSGLTNKAVLEKAYPAVFETDSSVTIGTIGGVAHTNDVLTITVTDPSLTGGNESVNYTVLAGESLSDITYKLKEAINANADLSSHGFKAYASGTKLTIFAPSGSATTYSKSISSGGTETITLGAPNYLYKHLLAEEVPVDTGKSDTGLSGATHYFKDTGEGARFVCTKYLIHTLIHDGVHPTNTQLTNQGCPNITGW